MKYLLLTAAVLFAAGAMPVYAGNYMFHQVQTTILVADPEYTADLITVWTEEQGGYYIYRSLDRIVLRVPSDEMSSLRRYLEQISDAVVEVSIQSNDLREQLVTLRSSIKSSEEILARNLEYLDRTDVKGTLAIEQEVRSLLVELESYKGSLRKLEFDRQFAYYEVLLSFKEQILPQDIPSSFEWINRIDFYRFAEQGAQE